MNTQAGIIGLVIYTGSDTKLMKNQNKSRQKMSNVEKQMNVLVVGMFVFVNFISMLAAGLCISWNKSVSGVEAHYLALDESLTDEAGEFFIRFLSYMLLNGTFIPISLLVTVEVVKIVQGWFIGWDIEMVHVEYEDVDG